MKKLFGGIDLTWKKLIIFAVISGLYTGIMAMLPITENTSFRDIAIQFEWWIFFGIIIICNSKSYKDSALKCFIFFLISQPLVYLIQVPFSSMGFGLFGYYRYWFIWTLLTIPMGFIGYYIKKNNWLSAAILLPMMIALAFLGLGYFTEMLEDFPHHLLSFIACFAFIIIVVLNLFDKKSIKIVLLSIVAVTVITIIILKGGILSSEYEVYESLDDYGINFEGEIYVSTFSGDEGGNAEVVSATDDGVIIKLKGKRNGKYIFKVTDDSNKEYSFEYHFDKDQQTVVLNKTDN